MIRIAKIADEEGGDADDAGGVDFGAADVGGVDGARAAGGVDEVNDVADAEVAAVGTGAEAGDVAYTGTADVGADAGTGGKDGNERSLAATAFTPGGGVVIGRGGVVIGRGVSPGDFSAISELMLGVPLASTGSGIALPETARASGLAGSWVSPSLLPSEGFDRRRGIGGAELKGGVEPGAGVLAGVAAGATTGSTVSAVLTEARAPSAEYEMVGAMGDLSALVAIAPSIPPSPGG